MLWGFEIAVAIYFGYEFVSLFAAKTFDGFQRLAIGTTIGIIIQTWFVFIISYFIELAPPLGLITIIVFLVLSQIIHQINHKNNVKMEFKITTIQIWTYSISFAFWFYTMYLSMFENNEYSKGSGFSDLGFHLNIISSITHGINHRRQKLMSLRSTFYAGVDLVYPFIPNFYSAFLISTGHCSIRYSLMIPSTLIGWSFIVGLYSLTLLLARSHLASALSVFIFFNLGGLGFFSLLEKECRDLPMWDLDFAVCNRGKNYFWFHPITHVLIPQRASLWAYPLLLWTYTSLIISIIKKDFKLMALAGILTGVMPNVQLHAYVSVAQWSVLYCLVKLIEKEWRRFKQYFMIWSLYGAIAISLALPQMPLYLKRVNNASYKFLDFNPIWNYSDLDCEDNIFKPVMLWIKSLGFFAIISLLGGILVLKKFQFLCYIPSLIIFIVANLILYQPWALDNTKIFYTGWIPFAVPVVANFLQKIVMINTKKVFEIISYFILILILVITCLSGFLTTVTTYNFPVSMFKEKGAFKFGLWVAENTPINAIFSVDGGPGNPVPTIGGRQMYCGYGGWIYTHGLSMDRWYETVGVARDSSNFTFFNSNNILYAGNIATTDYPFAKPKSGWTTVYEGDKNFLYRIVKN